jgi:hypothetical protein
MELYSKSSGITTPANMVIHIQCSNGVVHIIKNYYHNDILNSPIQPINILVIFFSSRKLILRLLFKVLIYTHNRKYITIIELLHR